MENNDAFEADAGVDILSKLRSRSSHRPSHKGRDAINAANGGIGSRKDTYGENSPLLSDGQERDGETADAGNGDDRPPPTWDGERDYEGLPWLKTPSVYWLLPAFLLFTMAFGGVIVPKLNLILSLICQEYFSEKSFSDPSFHLMPVILGEENPQCRIAPVQALVSKFTLYGNLISGLLAAIISPKLGALSDRYGRTKLIAMTTLGLSMSEVITIIVATYSDMLSVNWILLGYAFDGLGGTFIAAMALSFAYASDCTIPEKRNVAFSYYHACLFGGIALGPVLAGYVVEATGNLLTIFYISIGCHGIFLFWLLCVVPESLTKERQLAAREKKALAGRGEEPSSKKSTNLIRTIKSANLLAPLTILWPKEKGTNPAVRRNLVFLAAVDTIMFGVAMGSMTVILIYSEYIFSWGTLKTTQFVSITNACRVTCLVVLLPAASRLIRGPASKANQRNSGCDNIDLGIIRLAIFFDLLGYVGYAIVRDDKLFILSGVIASIGGMGSPTLSAALTKHVPPRRTGQVLGAVGLLHAAARVVAPTIFNLIYAKTVGVNPQTVFVCLSATFGLAFLLSWFIRPHVYWDQSNQNSDGAGADDQFVDTTLEARS